MPNLGDALDIIGRPNLDVRSGVLTDSIPPAITRTLKGSGLGGKLGAVLSSTPNLTAALGLQGRLNNVLGKLGKDVPFNLNVRLMGAGGKLGKFIKPPTQGKYSKHAGSGVEGNAISPYSSGAFIRPTQFKTIIGLPQGLSSKFSSEIVSYSCQNCTLPGRRFSTGDARRGNTIIQKVPYDVLYPEVSMTFQVTKGMKERELFEAWQDLIYNPKTNIFGYPDDYMTPVYIIQLDNKTDEVRKYTLNEAFPLSVGDIQLGWDAFDQIETFTVGFIYKTWSVETI